MAQLYTDHHFHIGSAHLTSGKPCQDYANSVVYNSAALAIISDGCSTGGHTDIGSRVLALSTMAALRDHWITNCDALSETVPQEISLSQKIVSAGIRQLLNLKPQDMLATCVYAYISPNGGFVHVQGDGVVILKYQDKRIEVSKFEWSDNKPFYPAYSEFGLSNFIQAHGDNLNNLRLSEEKWTQRDEEEFVDCGSANFTLSEGICGITINIPEKLLIDLKFIAVFSDGITQIDKIDWKSAVQMFTAFKNTKGEFAKRRMIRGIRDTQKIGKGPLDDIACAIVRVEPTET